MAVGSEEPNALVTVDRGGGRMTPNLRATQVELYAGLRAFSQNRYPSLAWDFGAMAGAFGPLLPAGFYYKTFMWPRGFWRHVYEPAIRAAAGLGRAPGAPDPDWYLHRYAHCDTLVIGAGPAGLAAALAASARGARVVVCDEQAEMGGSLLSEMLNSDWLNQAVATLEQRAEVTLLPRTTAFGWYPDNMIGLVERITDHLAEPDPGLPRERLWHVRAKRVVIATGALERPLVFPGNDRPGVMLAGAAGVYLQRYGVKVGEQVVLLTTDDSAYAVGAALQEAGASVIVADARMEPSDTALGSGLPVRHDVFATGTRGRMRVHRVRLSNGESLPCDAVLMCGGWTPSVHLFSQSRSRLIFDEQRQVFLPGAWTERVRSAGACNGSFGIDACAEEGFAAGDPEATELLHIPEPAAKYPGFVSKTAFVDFQNDVTARDLRLATREGFRSIEHVKRYTTTGMATDQGKTSNMNALTAVSGILNRSIADVGTTTFRPPYTPVTFGAFAGASRGELLDPVRRTPLHDWAAECGAVFENVGNWQRARYFPRGGEDMHQAVARECRAVRGTAGIFDGSTLGKIEVTGPDAAVFLSRMYINRFVRLAPGRCRYGLMLSEAGYVMDDGVIARLAPDRFHVTTTTGGAASVLHHMEDYRQTEFTDLRVWLTSTTEQWAVIAVQGPRAREVIAPLVQDIDLAAMPHMSVREGRIRDVPMRLFRVSFTGESGYEINVPADHGRDVWEAVFAAGEPHGIMPYGTEAMHVLRAEKGYIIVGQETDGTVTPWDIGVPVGRQRDFVGKRSLTRVDMVHADRKQLVGLMAPEVLEEGAQLVAGGPSLGHVTSAYWSETLQRPIALALLSGGWARMGQILHVPMADRTIAVRVTDPVFYDEAGERLHG